MGNKIAIAGAGGFSKEVYLIIEAINKIAPTWDFVGFFDDKVPRGKFFMDFEVLGNMQDLNNTNEDIYVAVAAGRSDKIIAIVNKLTSPKIFFPNIIHPSVFLHFETLTVGEGNIIQSGSSFSADNRIGKYNIFNASVKVGHDAIIGNYNTFATGTLISGGVEIGDQNNFGINSGILQYKKVGNGNTIGPLSILFKSIRDNGHYLGVPALPTGI
ncbi:MAG: hypothetical protein KF746_03545 [Chitinophagaceae bacterium]|nr:hypothetical protein [Chitinophagaceae bacterium]